MHRKKYNPLAVIIFLLGLGILTAAIVKSRDGIGGRVLFNGCNWDRRRDRIPFSFNLFGRCECMCWF
jgi:hypothetical protein